MKNDYAHSAEYYDLIHEIHLGKQKFAKSAQFIAKLLKRYKAKSVLELGCGTGLYLFPLKKQRFAIEGLDISKQMLAVARKKDKRIKLYQQDMSKFTTKKTYDAILCLNSSFVLLPNLTQMKQTLKRIHAHLQPGGICILDLPNHTKEIKELNNTQEHIVKTIRGKQVDVTFRDYKKNNRWISEWHGFVRKEKQFFAFKEHYAEFIYSPKLLEQALRKQGFTIVQRFGSRTGGKFDVKKSYRRVYILIK